MKNGLNVKALVSFSERIHKLHDAVVNEDKAKQLIALTQAIDDLKEAKQTLLDSLETHH